MNTLTRFLPFLRWFPLTGDNLKADFMAGITVALVLIPQSMAYAQLAGLPAYYGLYAAFLPVAVAALWGSSNQLGTGPVAVVSLLTASSLAVLAPPGSDHFIALAIMLTLLVGVIQLLLGVFRLGVIVNFLSHPVIVGFINAAAIIIGLSQISKLFGVSMNRSDTFMVDILGVVRQIGDTHIPTLIMGLAAIATMWTLRKYKPNWPGVLIAVVLATLVSWAFGFEKTGSARVEDVADAQTREMVMEYGRSEAHIEALNGQLADKGLQLKRIVKEQGALTHAAATVNYEIDLLKLQLTEREGAHRRLESAIRSLAFERVPGAGAQSATLYPAGLVTAGELSDGHRWRIKKVDAGEFVLAGGGEVVGGIPEGLPSIGMPRLDWEAFGALFSAALVISLVGFMEAISIAKAIAARTRQRLDPDQELVGQGLANIVGSFSQSFPVSGSFSRSAVNLNAGARTGLSSVITAGFVLLALLFLTPLLYHLPQAVLAAIIIMAVVGLVNFQAIKHAWRTHRHDGAAAGVTFIATLAFAPHLDKGIMVGAGLALVLYLLRTMKPRVALLGRYKDGTLRDLKVNPGLPTSEHVVAIRFDGSLYFANVAYFEDAVLEAVANQPKMKYLLIVGDAINELDASGEEVVRHLVQRLRDSGVELVFSGLKKQVLDIMRTTGLIDLVGQNNIFATEDQAISAIYERLGNEAAADQFCLVRSRPAQG